MSPEITDYFGRPSLSTDYALATTVAATRTAGATVLEAEDVSKFSDDTPVFIITYKKVTDPETGEVSVSELRSFKALVNTGANTFTNLTIAPGYVDDIGNDEGDFIECIPTSYWGNSLIDGLLNFLTPAGELQAEAPIDSPQATLANVTPVGSVLDFAGTSAPTGWLLCYGQTLDADSNPEYQDLYDVIGNTFGGSDNSDFVVPDLRGRVVAGQDDMGGSSANRLTGASGGVNGDTFGAAGGAETHTLITAEMPAHTHTTTIGVSGANNGMFHNQNGTTAASDGSVNGTDTSNSTGGGGAHNNVQPTIILNKIIKY